jgi:hypothetical protein
MIFTPKPMVWSLLNSELSLLMHVRILGYTHPKTKPATLLADLGSSLSFNLCTEYRVFLCKFRVPTSCQGVIDWSVAVSAALPPTCPVIAVLHRHSGTTKRGRLLPLIKLRQAASPPRHSNVYAALQPVQAGG